MMHRHARHSGFALLMVLSVVAFTSVMGIAMLWSSSLRANAVYAAADSAVAGYNAESAVNLTMFWLTNIDEAPAAFASAMTIGTTWQDPAYTLPSPAEGYVSLTVTRVAGSGSMYDITAVGSPATAGSSVTRTISTRVLLRLRPWTTTQAAIFNTSATVSTRVTLNGNVTLNGTVSVTGSGATKGAVTGTVTTANKRPAPRGAEVLQYTDTYWYDNPADAEGARQYNVGLITNSLDLMLAPQFPATNPAGIFRYTGNANSTLSLSTGLNFKGTLIVPGRLSVSGNGITLTPKSGFPALIVGKDIYLNGLLRTMTVNGVVWCKDGVGSTLSATSSTLTVNGALILDNANFANPTSGRRVTVNYDNSRLPLVELAPSWQAVEGIRLMSWSTPNTAVTFTPQD